MRQLYELTQNTVVELPEHAQVLYSGEKEYHLLGKKLVVKVIGGIIAGRTQCQDSEGNKLAVMPVNVLVIKTADEIVDEFLRLYVLFS